MELEERHKGWSLRRDIKGGGTSRPYTFAKVFCLGTEVPRHSAGVVRTGYVISSTRAQCELASN